jgi:hypothetical protein
MLPLNLLNPADAASFKPCRPHAFGIQPPQHLLNLANVVRLKFKLLASI